MRYQDRDPRFVYLAGLALTLAVTYCVYWVFKTVSYELFYEGMVEQTVREMVKPEYLQDAYRK